jgi:Na+(H+)/acetate symporter ActP
MIAIATVAAVTLGALGLGAWGVRFRTTSDLYVASRAVSPWWNAAAVSGEYLSAASFLGIAGLEMKIGVPALWQGIGFTAGYLALLLFVAAPLRRFGSYTIPDFAEGRLGSRRLRMLAVGTVLVIAGFYMIPQLKGAGIAMQEVTGAPYWVGIVVVGTVVVLNVGLGGMRGITYVQAYQFWVKTAAISIPAILLLIHLGGLPERGVLFGAQYPHAPAGGLVVTYTSPQTLTFPAPTGYRVNGVPRFASRGEQVRIGAARLRLPPGAPVPLPPGTTALRGHEWSKPVGTRGQASPLFIYSLLLATFLGTMGLPHILVRFYTNRDGYAARRTTVRVLGLLGAFYMFPAVYGALGRALAPSLYMTDQTDTVVLRLPELAWPGAGGQILGALTAAGAFAAFMSTASGLLVSIAGTVSFDLWGRGRGRPAASLRRRRFRIAAAAGMALPAVLALVAGGVQISILVGWAFALAASTFCPLFVLGIWWPRLTSRAAAAGMLGGGLVASAAILVGLAAGAPNGTSVSDALLAQPALISVPMAFALMIGVSLRTARPADVSAQMLALHAPEGLGLEAFEQARS